MNKKTGTRPNQGASRFLFLYLFEPRRDLALAQDVTEMTGDADAAAEDDAFISSFDFFDQCAQAFEAFADVIIMEFLGFAGVDHVALRGATAFVQLHHPDRVAVVDPFEAHRAEALEGLDIIWQLGRLALTDH